MKQLFGQLLILAITGSAWAKPPLTRGTLPWVIDQIGNQLDSARYDSAQFYINRGGQLVRQRPNLELAFYLSAYQSELFYHNALFEQGIQYALRGLQQANTLGDSTLTANQHNLLGLLYTELGQFTKAIGHLEQSLRLLPAQPRSRFGLTHRYHILANLGQCYTNIGQHGRAIQANQQSFDAAARDGSGRGMAIAAWSMATDYATLAQPTDAGRWFQACLRHARRVGDYDAAMLAYPGLFHLLVNRQPDVAQRYLAEGIAQMNQHGDRISTYRKRQFAEELTKIYFTLKNFPRAVESHRLLEQINREIADKEKEQRLAMLQAYYENERQLLRAQAADRARQQELQQQRVVALGMGGLAALLGLALVAVYYGYRQKQKVNDLRQQQQINELEQREEIASLKAVMTGEEGERVRIARELHDGLSSLLAAARFQVEAGWRATSPKTGAAAPTTLLDQASEEVRRISHNLMPYALQQFGLLGAIRHYVEHLGKTRPTVAFSSDGPEPALVGTAQLWLYRCVQELVGNALRHAHARHVWVSATSAPDRLTLSVRDDGRGFDADALPDADRNGLRNIQTRLSYLGASLTLRSRPGEGTECWIELTITEPLAEV